MRTRRPHRWLRRLGALALLALVLALAPVTYIETACQRGGPAPVPGQPLPIADAGYKRPETNSYLSYPEWYIVYAYQDLAGVMQTRDEHAFRYTPSIAGFWTGLCGVSRVAAARGGGELDEKVMLYIIGLSFTVELGIKGAYESTIGRLTSLIRGPDPTPEDAYARRVATEYAAFLQQTPWYEFPFLGHVRALWSTIPFNQVSLVRSIERRIALTLEWSGKAAYAAGIKALAGLSPAEERIGAVLRGPADPGLRVVRTLPDGGTLIDAPRYAAFTALVAGLAASGRDLVEIAGNRAILVTALLPEADAPPPGARLLFTAPIQSRPGWQRIGLDVPVPALTETIRTLTARGATFEHVYDY